MKIIGELINNSYARARRAWRDRSLEGYRNLVKLQSNLGVDYLTVNLDGTQNVTVKLHEMLDFLPDLVPAIQEATSVPLAFDNPSVDFHRIALEHYDRSKSGAPILNSLAASREKLDEMIGLVRDHDTLVIVMASEKFEDGRGAQSLTLAEALGLDFVLGNPEKNPRPLDSNHPLVRELHNALEQGRCREGESQEDAGFRQAEAILELCRIDD